MTSIAFVLGSVTAPGRLSTAISGTVARAEAAGHSATLLDLGALAIGFADGRPLEQLSDDSPAFVRAVSEADVVILATPVYRGTLTGALKNALDLLPVEALRRKPVGIVAMGATHHHFLGAESHLRDILAWFGALSLPTAIYLASSDFVDGKLTDAAAGELDELVATAALLAAVSPKILGPTPFPAKRG